jgi:ATP-binding cassette subfamily B protein
MPEQTGPWSPRSLTLRRLLGLARLERARLMLGTVFLAVGSAMGLFYPKVAGTIIDAAVAGGDRSRIDRAALEMVAIALVQSAAISLRYVHFSIAGESVVTALREKLYASVLEQDIGFFDERRTGDLTNRLASDTSVLQSAVSANISMGLRNAASVLGGLCFLFYTSPVLTALMLLVVPAVAIGAVYYGRYVRRLSKAVQDALAQSNEVAEESISGIRTVRSFAAEAGELARYGKAVRHSFALAKARVRAGAGFMSAASFAAFGAAALVFWYGGRLVYAHQLKPGELTQFLIYTLIVAMSLAGLTDLWADFMKSLGAAERVFEILDRTPTIPSASGLRPATSRGRVDVEQVRFAYPSRPDVPVFQGIDLSLAEGEAVALVGPSGAGKSTVAALLARFYDPLAGRILFDGADVRTLDPQWLRRQIATVAQEPLLFSSSVADNIRYGRPSATPAEVEAAARAAHAHEFVSRFPQGYATLVGERGVQLSGGQKQRVAIARALLKDARLLVLDEATSALDAESEALVQDALERLMRGRTTLVIAHRLSTVMRADRVLVLDGGRVVQQGSHAALLAEEGLYRKLVERQFVDRPGLSTPAVSAVAAPVRSAPAAA